MSDPDLLVIGAGAAGIAAAREAISLGLTVRVLEARDRVGGRAHTDATTLGAPFDLGATWLHAAEGNPLVPLAGARGLELFDHDAVRSHRTWVDDHWATDGEAAEYAAAERAWHEALALVPDGTRSLADAAPRGGRWDATIAHWEGPVICGAEVAAMDFADYLATELHGTNLLPRDGAGHLLGLLADGLPITLAARVDRIAWGGPRVRAEGSFGAVEAAACLVTVSTGVLAAGSIAFDPPLPAATLTAVHDLPMGLLTKLGLRAAGEDRLDIPAFAGLERRLEEGERGMTWIGWPFGRDHLMGFAGGALAWDLAREGAAATVDHARAELRRVYGARADRAVRADGALLSDWATDPFSLGAYAYLLPGRGGAREALGRPLGDGRLRFAGEACHPHLAGTLGGAWYTGVAAAREAAARAGAGRGLESGSGSPPGGG